MDEHYATRQRWAEVLAMYGEYFPHWSRDTVDRLARHAELIEELLNCRGIMRLHPITSHFSLGFIRSDATDHIPGDTYIDIEVPSTGEYLIALAHYRRIPPASACQSERLTLYDRTCPHVRSAVRAVRVAARLMGVKISQPQREKPPAGAMRRQWLVISKDGLFAPPRPKVYRELRLDGFAFEE
ncbi:hypothetical protein [Limnoglobus roseus]|uniref:Uncharacterized protein n=1 Tax=Limnoglobus roseus TaxID=2598579 RepID=A0A5C1A7V5_9BACT|nr:hypothetical protein [Limnoglobus roseus]QEL13932.1 hypothetical protein PX52LOC_00792 [Limnoglobus roseus]